MSILGRVGRWLCAHDWRPDGQPSELVSAFSIVAASGSELARYRAYRQWFSCSKCNVRKFKEWDNGALRSPR